MILCILLEKCIIFVSGDVKLGFLSPVFLYSLAVLLSAMAIAAVLQFQLIQNIRTEHFTDCAIYLTIIIFYTPLQIIPVTNCIEVKKQVKFINSWSQLQVIIFIFCTVILLINIRKLRYMETKGYLHIQCMCLLKKVIKIVVSLNFIFLTGINRMA